MKRNNMIMLSLLAILILAILLNISLKLNSSPADQITQGIRAILSDEPSHVGVTNIFTKEQKNKLSEFREKFAAEDITYYNIEAFKPEDENIVYLMLISRPSIEENEGLVLYMTFNLKSSSPLEIDSIIISNWVEIQYDAIQF